MDLSCHGLSPWIGAHPRVGGMKTEDKTKLTRLLQDDHRLVEMKTEDKDEKSRVWIIKWPFKG